MGDLKNIIISVLIFTLVMVGFIGLYGNFASIYDIDDEGKINDSHQYDKVNQSYDMIIGMKDKIYNNTITDEQALDFSIRNSYASMRTLISGSVETIKFVAWEVQYQMGLPSWVIKLFLTAVIAIIILAFVSLFLRVKL